MQHVPLALCYSHSPLIMNHSIAESKLSEIISFIPNSCRYMHVWNALQLLVKKLRKVDNAKQLNTIKILKQQVNIFTNLVGQIIKETGQEKISLQDIHVSLVPPNLPAFPLCVCRIEADFSCMKLPIGPLQEARVTSLVEKLAGSREEE